jgi:hypothetical protein
VGQINIGNIFASEGQELIPSLSQIIEMLSESDGAGFFVATGFLLHCNATIVVLLIDNVRGPNFEFMGIRLEVKHKIHFMLGSYLSRITRFVIYSCPVTICGSFGCKTLQTDELFGSANSTADFSFTCSY